MDILNIQNLTKRFGSKEVLRGLNLSVPEHSIFGFVGKNGAGKTTTMKAILGLLTPDSGEIRIGGERVRPGQTATNRMIGYLPDVPEFYGFLTAQEYLHLLGDTLGIPRAVTDVRSKELLTLVGLAGEKHRIRGYSRGMKQRLGIAQALLSSPKLLICDEPTSALDPIGRKEILDILLSVRDRTTVLFSTHILSDVERICTDVALLHDGKIAMQGTVEELRASRGKEEFTLELMSREEAKLVLQHFPHLYSIEPDVLVIPDGDEGASNVMAFLSGKRISVRRLERNEPTLESLFLEVVKS